MTRIFSVGDRVRVNYAGGEWAWFRRAGERLGLEAGDTGSIMGLSVSMGGVTNADITLDRNPGDTVHSVPVYILEPLTPSAEPAG